MSSGHECRCPVAEPHATFGACLRYKGPRVAFCQSAAGKDYTAQRRWDNDLEAYASARRQGVQPSATSRGAVDSAMQISDKLGVAFQA